MSVKECLRTSRSMRGMKMWYVGGVLSGIRYNGDSDVVVLVVRDSEPE